MHTTELVLFLYITFIADSTTTTTIERLELVMPKYAVKGGDVILKCDHSVPPEQLHKVEWKKGGVKIFQYVKGRTPPFRYFATAGAELNKEHSSEKQIQLSNLDFTASGSYSCIVSMETPIFSKETESHELTVIEPQEDDPVITFNKDTYEIGEMLEANCTASAARPPPHITWLINNEKVDDSFTRPYSNGRAHGHGYFERKSPSTTQMSVEVSELHGGDDGLLRLTCISTIPGYIGHNEKYADIRTASVIVDIIIKESIPAEAILEASSSTFLFVATKSAIILTSLLLLEFI